MLPVEELRYGEARGRWVLLATVLGSGMAFLDATVVNIALPAIGKEFDAGIVGLQWTVNGYTLTLAALILLGGSAGDRFGRRRIFLVGVLWFAAASLLCGIAPNVESLVAARAVQGIGAALLTPGSLAILQASFRPGDRARAIGAWSGLAGIAGAIGPFVGGWLVETASWRWVFLLNLPVAAFVVWVALRHMPESRNAEGARRIDWRGAMLGVLALAALTYGLVSWGAGGSAGDSAGDSTGDTTGGWGSAATVGWLILALVLSIAFVRTERRSAEPMLPLDLFATPLFRAVNVVTFAVYAALSGVMFMLVITLQLVAEFDAVASGAALLPVTLVMLVLSARAGQVAERIGPRLPMTIGPIVSATGVGLLVGVDADTSYVPDVLPGVLLFGLGLSATVAPLTSTVLAAAPVRHAGVASGVNNAVARSAGLLIVAVLPALVGLGSRSYADPDALLPAYVRSMWWCAGLLALGGVLSALLVRPDSSAPKSLADHVEAPVGACRTHCAVGAPPLQPDLEGSEQLR